MRTRRGMTLIELLAGIFTMMLVVLGSLVMMVAGTQSFNVTNVDTDLNDKNAQGLRHVVQTIRSAYTVSVSTDGKTITYVLPKLNASNDALTGEQEYVTPLVGDGVNRTFVVDTTAGTLKDTSSGQTLVKNIIGTDPQVGSSTYGQTYKPFSLSAQGALQAVSINLICQDHVIEKVRFQRMKTTAIARNTG